MTGVYNVVDADGHILEPLDLWDKYKLTGLCAGDGVVDIRMDRFSEVKGEALCELGCSSLP